MKRNGPKAGMMESPQIAAECVQMAAASRAGKPREMKQELRQFPQNEPRTRKAGKAKRLGAGYTKLPARLHFVLCMSICTCAQAKGVTSKYRFPHPAILPLFPSSVAAQQTSRLSMSGGALNIFPSLVSAV